MSDSFQAEFPRLQLVRSARFDVLIDTLHQLEAFAKRHAVAGDAVARLLIIVEELYSNSIKYGYGGPCDREIRLTLTLHPGVTLIYQDDAPPFDPTSWDVEPALSATAEDRPVGQLGIALVRGLAHSIVYSSRSPGNQIVVSIVV
jgi:serine/threonine-protein kinase RsbW